MKPPPLNYCRPATLDDALRVLADDADAVILAGGQSLIPLLNLRLARPSTLVDITRVESLDEISAEGGSLVIGAAARQLRVQHDAMVLERCPALSAALGLVGHQQIRSRGTIGGSLAHADPAAELATLGVALDASVLLARPGATREMPVAEFILGPYTTALEAGEIVVGVRVPYHRPTSAFVEFARRDGDFALMSVAVAASFSGRRLTDVKVAIGGAHTGPVRVRPVEDALLGTTMGERDIARAAELAAAAVAASDEVLVGDGEAGDGYRRRLAAALVDDALEEVSRGRHA